MHSPFVLLDPSRKKDDWYISIRARHDFNSLQGMVTVEVSYKDILLAVKLPDDKSAVVVILDDATAKSLIPYFKKYGLERADEMVYSYSAVDDPKFSYDTSMEVTLYRTPGGDWILKCTGAVGGPGHHIQVAVKNNAAYDMYYGSENWNCKPV